MKSIPSHFKSIFSAEESFCVLRVQWLDSTGGNEQDEYVEKKNRQKKPSSLTLLPYMTERNEPVDPFGVTECVGFGESYFVAGFQRGNGFSDENISES
jgi:hypothetical protein